MKPSEELRSMLAHSDEYFNQFEFADVLADREFDAESEENPFLHIGRFCEYFGLVTIQRKEKLSYHFDYFVKINPFFEEVFQ